MANNRVRTAKGTFTADHRKQEAKLNGDILFQGEDCKYNHGGMRFVSNNGCVECLKESAKKYYEKNKEKMQKKNRDYAKADPVANNERSKKWAEKNPEKMKSIRSKQYYKNPQLRVQQTAEWQKANPDMHQANMNQKRARDLGVKGKVTAEEWTAIKNKYGNICLCCKKPSSERKLTVDHVIPISKGGTHTADNIQPLCHSCNSRKRTSTIDFRRFYENVE
jgi:5-methylcytosine-specific restriction endonuclease McrA